LKRAREPELQCRRGSQPEIRPSFGGNFGLAAGEGSTADVGKARHAAEESRTIIADLEAAFAGISEQRRALADEVAKHKRERERQRQERAAQPLREEADRYVVEFIAGLTALCEPLLKRKALASRFSRALPLATGIPGLTVDALARALQSALSLPNDADGTRVARAIVSRALGRPLDFAFVPPLKLGADRLQELGVSD